MQICINEDRIQHFPVENLSDVYTVIITTATTSCGGSSISSSNNPYCHSYLTFKLSSSFCSSGHSMVVNSEK
jgi:hypothetical protein